MPCTDVTEIIRIRLDDEDRLLGYQLRKRTCGRSVGEESLLDGELAGRPAAEILALGTDEFADAAPGLDETSMFFRLKHFFAVRSGLRILLGLDAGGAQEAVRVAKVGYEEGEVVLDADISVDIITEQIKACGRCRGCASISKELARA